MHWPSINVSSFPLKVLERTRLLYKNQRMYPFVGGGREWVEKGQGMGTELTVIPSLSYEIPLPFISCFTHRDFPVESRFGFRFSD